MLKGFVADIIHISKFPVQRLNILISGGIGSATFSFRKRQQQYCMSFEFMQSIPRFSSNSTHSLSKPPRQISLNALLTPYPHHTNKHTPTLPFFCSLAIVAHKGKESVLIWQSEQPFRRPSLHSGFLSLNGNCSFHLAASPAGELLGSPAAEGQMEGGGCRSQGPGQGLAGGR